MNQEMIEYIEKTPIEEIIYRADFVQVTKMEQGGRWWWVVTLMARMTEKAMVYVTAWDTLVQSKHYLFYKEIK